MTDGIASDRYPLMLMISQYGYRLLEDKHLVKSISQQILQDYIGSTHHQIKFVETTETFN